MTDFTIELRQQCSKSVDVFQVTTHFGGYTQYYSTRGVAYCSCKGYQFRKACKHRKMFEDSLCHWHEAWSDETQTEEQKRDMICPVCGSATQYVKVAV